jgi:Cu-Zn family superoxide dismutase
VTFRLDARGVPLGLHGIHVHAVGRCQGPGFESAGPHWNPNGRRHGFNNPAGPHRGDLQNVTVTATGVLTESVTLAGTRLAEMADADGSALVLHAARDDFTTDPSGNSGARIACAVISPPAGG